MKSAHDCSFHSCKWYIMHEIDKMVNLYDAYLAPVLAFPDAQNRTVSSLSCQTPLEHILALMRASRATVRDSNESASWRRPLDQVLGAWLLFWALRRFAALYRRISAHSATGLTGRLNKGIFWNKDGCSIFWQRMVAVFVSLVPEIQLRAASFGAVLMPCGEPTARVL
jgi:hypothetical protein